jgi:hypothetical protein
LNRLLNGSDGTLGRVRFPAQVMPQLACAAAALLIAGCAAVRPKPKPILIGIDQQFGLASLVPACAFRAAQAKAAPQYATPCLETPGVMMQEIQNAFQSAFQENPACEGVSLKSYENLGSMAGVAWRMKFFVRVQDDGTASIADSSWEIDPFVPDAQSADGAVGDPFQTATRVCAVVKHRGGTVQ